MNEETNVEEVAIGAIDVITKSGRLYCSFQKGKDSVESAKQEAEFIM